MGDCYRTRGLVLEIRMAGGVDGGVQMALVRQNRQIKAHSGCERVVYYGR